jgi:hypothetical protein
MGLDISAVSKLEPIEVPEDIEQWSDEWYDWEADQGGDVYNVWSSPNFPEQAEGMEDGTYIARDSQHTSFRAGSYSGYGTWRDWLAQATMGGILNKSGGAQSMWDSADGGDYGLPFMELINFSDAEGIIGPVASKKLYYDFRKYENDVMDWMDRMYLSRKPIDSSSWDEKEPQPLDKGDFEWFQRQYQEWKNAFRIASDNGIVMFH